MQNGEIIPALIARIRQNNTDNVVIRSKLYNLLNDVTRKFNEAMIACPHIVDFQNMSNEQVLEHYYLSVGAESLWDSRELIMKAISEQNKLIKEEYDKELGKIEIVTQQYQLGLYVAIYKNKRLINQFGSNLKEVAYHRKVRIRAIKRGGTIVDGTILETKSKYPINTFENESSKEVSK